MALPLVKVYFLVLALIIPAYYSQTMNRVAFRVGAQAKYYRNGNWHNDKNQGFLNDSKAILKYCRKVYDPSILSIAPAPNAMWIPNWNFTKNKSCCEESYRVFPFECLRFNLMNLSRRFVALSHCKFIGGNFPICQPYNVINQTAHEKCPSKNNELKYLAVEGRFRCMKLMEFYRYDGLCCNSSLKIKKQGQVDTYIKEGKRKNITSAFEEFYDFTMTTQFLDEKYSSLNQSIKDQIEPDAAKLKQELKKVAGNLTLVNDIHNIRILRYYETKLNDSLSKLQAALKRPQTEKLKAEIALHNEHILMQSIDFLNYTFTRMRVYSMKNVKSELIPIKEIYIRLNHKLHICHALLKQKDDLSEDIFKNSEKYYATYLKFNLKVIKQLFGKDVRGQKISTPSGKLYLVTEDGDIVPASESHSGRTVAIIFGVVLALTLVGILFYYRSKRFKRAAYEIHSPKHMPPEMGAGFKPSNVTMSHLGDYLDEDDEQVYHDNHAKLEIGYENAMFDANDKTKIVA